MTTFGGRTRELMAAQGIGVRELARRTYYDKALISRVLSGQKSPSAELARRLDEELGAGGELQALRPVRLTNDLELIELARRAEQSSIGSETLDEMETITDQMCRAYSTQGPTVLRNQTTTHLRYILGLLDGRTTLDQHRELLVRAGWDALLLGCLAYDVDDRPAAGQAQRLAYQLGDQAGHGEIVAWSYELGAWFALVEGRYLDAVNLSERGMHRAGVSSAAVQLTLQASHGYARVGDRQARHTLDAGRKILDRLPRPERPEHHFVFDPDKHTFYVAKVLTSLGKDDAAAEEHGREVIGHCAAAGRWPMRMAESQINLGMIAARRGDLEEAVGLAASALQVERRSGGLLPHARELLHDLTSRYPHERLTDGYRELLGAVHGSPAV